MRERDHHATLVAMRDRLRERARRMLARRRRFALVPANAFDLGLYKQERVHLRENLRLHEHAQIRALDAVLAYAEERAFMAELWMLIACGKSQRDAVKEARATMAERGGRIPEL